MKARIYRYVRFFTDRSNQIPQMFFQIIQVTVQGLAGLEKTDGVD